MNTQIRVVCFLALIAIAAAFSTANQWRGCIYVNGKCHKECEEGTHSYMPEGYGGCGYKIPEATCDQPFPEKEKFPICDYSACYCDRGTYRNAKGKCVLLEDCPKKN